MKIGVTGSEHICDRIQKTLEKRMPDLEVVYRRSNDYRYGLEAAAQFQKGKVSGIIFTGPTNYHYALKRLEPNVKSAGRICCPLFLRAGCHQYRYV